MITIIAARTQQQHWRLRNPCAWALHGLIIFWGLSANEGVVAGIATVASLFLGM